MRGQLHTMLDRANPLFPSDYKFREIYLLSSVAGGEKDSPGALSNLMGWIKCFPKCRLTGKVFRGDFTEGGEMSAKQGILDKVYVMGKVI